MASFNSISLEGGGGGGGGTDSEDKFQCHEIPLHLCEFALDEFNAREDEFYENVNVVETVYLLSSPPTTCLLIAFQAYLPADKTTKTFETKIIFRSRRTAKIVIVFVRIKGHDENLLDEPIDNLSDSEDYDDDELCPLNPAFLKKDIQDNLPDKDPERGPTYRPCPNLKRMRRPTSRYKEGSELSKEIESFKMDVERTGGFEVGYYPLMDQARISGTWIAKYYDIENRPIPAVCLSQLVHLSQLAICVYNMKEDTHFGNVKVLKAMTYGFGGISYNITFEAFLRDKNAEIFQTNICTSVGFPIKKTTITFVRIKPN